MNPCYNCRIVATFYFAAAVPELARGRRWVERREVADVVNWHTQISEILEADVERDRLRRGVGGATVHDASPHRRVAAEGPLDAEAHCAVGHVGWGRGHR